MSNQPKRARSMPPQERRAAIIDATLPLLVEFGDKVTSRQIALAAGVAEGTIFGVFEDKEALLVAAINELISVETIEQLIADIDPAAPFEEQMLASVEVQQHRIQKVFAVLSGISPQLRAQLNIPLGQSAALSELCERHRHQFRHAPATVAAQLRAVVVAMSHPMLSPAPAQAAEIVELFLHGACQGASDSNQGPKS